MPRLLGAAAALLLQGIAAASPAQTSPTAGSTLPPTAATASAATTQQAGKPLPAAGSATVTWTGALLTVSAKGESLRSVLARVARTTGMKVSGGVPDEPVFGTYGPGTVQAVLTSLFDGMSINLLLLQGGPGLPKQLTLTARTGGPTPPQPSQPLNASDDPAEVNLAQPQPQQPFVLGRHNSPNSFQQLPQDGPQTNNPGPAVPLNDAGAASGQAATDANGTPQSPNGVRTPEQIFEELRRRQQGNTAPQQ